MKDFFKKISALRNFTQFRGRVHIFQILVYSLLTNECNFCCNIVSTFLCIQTYRMFADIWRVELHHLNYYLTFLKLKPASGQAPHRCLNVTLKR